MNWQCPDIELELADFAAGDLEPAVADGVARHLAGCPECRAELERELRLRETLGALPPVAAPVGLAAAPVLAAAPRRRPRPDLTAAAGLVAAAVLAGLLAALPASTPPRAVSGAAAGGEVYTAGQVATARRDAARGLVLAARILERTELNAVSDVFGQMLPRAVTESLRGPSTPEGGQG